MFGDIRIHLFQARRSHVGHSIRENGVQVVLAVQPDDQGLRFALLDDLHRGTADPCRKLFTELPADGHLGKGLDVDLLCGDIDIRIFQIGKGSAAPDLVFGDIAQAAEHAAHLVLIEVHHRRCVRLEKDVAHGDVSVCIVRKVMHVAVVGGDSAGLVFIVPGTVGIIGPVLPLGLTRIIGHIQRVVVADPRDKLRKIVDVVGALKRLDQTFHCGVQIGKRGVDLLLRRIRILIHRLCLRQRGGQFGKALLRVLCVVIAGIICLDILDPRRQSGLIRGAPVRAGCKGSAAHQHHDCSEYGSQPLSRFQFHCVLLKINLFHPSPLSSPETRRCRSVIPPDGTEGTAPRTRQRPIRPHP